MPIATTGLAALSIGSTLSNYWGAQGAAKGVKAQGAYEAQVYEADAKMAEQQAEDALDRGQTDVQRHASAIRGLIDSQRTAMAASGINVDSGSALDVQVNDAGIGALDEQTIRNNAAREAWGYRAQASDFRNKGNLARLGASNTARGLRNQAYSTLLTGAATVGSLYKK